ncbi:hypothetical protein ABK040_011223 [Willaertia magna]
MSTTTTGKRKKRSFIKRKSEDTEEMEVITTTTNETKQKTNELPSEILIEICDFLCNPKDALSFILCCKDFYQHLFINKHPIFNTGEALLLLKQFKEYYLKKRRKLTVEVLDDELFIKHSKDHKERNNGLAAVSSMLNTFKLNTNRQCEGYINNEIKAQINKEIIFPKISNFLQNHVKVYYGEDVVDVIKKKVLNRFDFSTGSCKIANTETISQFEQKVVEIKLTTNGKNTVSLHEHFSNNKDNSDKIGSFVHKKYGVLYFEWQNRHGPLSSIRKILQLSDPRIEDTLENDEERHIIKRDYLFNTFNKLKLKFAEMKTENHFINNFSLNLNYPLLFNNDKVSLERLKYVINDEDLFNYYENDFKNIIEFETVKYEKLLLEKQCEDNYIVKKYGSFEAEDRLTSNLLLKIFLLLTFDFSNELFFYKNYYSKNNDIIREDFSNLEVKSYFH